MALSNPYLIIGSIEASGSIIASGAITAAGELIVDNETYALVKVLDKLTQTLRSAP